MGKSCDKGRKLQKEHEAQYERKDFLQKTGSNEKPKKKRESKSKRQKMGCLRRRFAGFASEKVNKGGGRTSGKGGGGGGGRFCAGKKGGLRLVKKRGRLGHGFTTD